MKRIVFALALVMPLLLLASVVMAPTFEEVPTTASVTINTFVDISLTPCAGGTASSIGYGGMDPGETDKEPELCQNSTDGALKTTVEATTNSPVNISLSGTNYTGAAPQEIAIENTKYDTDYNVSAPAPTAFPAEGAAAVQVFTLVGGTGTAADEDLWFWLSIPSEFYTAGSYTSTYTIRAE